LDDSVIISGDSGIFVSSLLVQRVNDLISEILEGFSDGRNGSLIREVLVSGQLNEGGDKGGENGVVFEVALDFSQVGLNSLDLDQ